MEAARAALQRTPQLSLESSDALLPARQNGRIPLRNSYRIELSLIEPDPDQPRRHFDEEALAELAASIRSRGIRQPLTVRWHTESGKYRIIDGERRFRAAALADLGEVPCVIDEGASRDVLIDQIVANWVRLDLRPYETADALVRLKSKYDMTPAQIAETTGKSLGEISRLIALVERVSPAVQEHVRKLAETSLTKRHLYALTQLPAERQLTFARRIEREHMSASETERMIRAGLDPSTTIRQRPRGRPRKHVRIATKYGVVQLIPDDPNFNDELLIAMLQEARRNLAAA